MPVIPFDVCALLRNLGKVPILTSLIRNIRNNGKIPTKCPVKPVNKNHTGI
jgi:Protein of unknown function (DUF1091)